MNKAKSGQLHVLFLPSFYDDPDKPVVGSFFKEQALAMSSIGVKVGLVYYEPRSLRAFSFSKLKESYFQTTSSNENGLTTVRLHGWNPYLQSSVGGLVWSLFTEHLVKLYISTNGRPDIIHAHNAVWAGYAASRINKRLGIPYVVTEHSGGFLSGNISGFQMRMARSVYSAASEVIAVSTTLANSLDILLMGRSRKIVPNCVDMKYFSLPVYPRKYSPFSFLMVARLTENKGVDVLLEAFAMRFRDEPDVYLRIGGDGPKMQDLVKLTLHLGVQDKVTFLGELHREGVRDAMWDSNVLIVSSFHETFGIVLIEAMATGIPVIATRCGGPNDIVTNKTGILVDIGNIRELAVAMDKLRNENVGSSAELRNYVNDSFSSSRVAGSIKNIYENCLDLK